MIRSGNINAVREKYELMGIEWWLLEKHYGTRKMYTCRYIQIIDKDIVQREFESKAVESISGKGYAF